MAKKTFCKKWFQLDSWGYSLESILADAEAILKRLRFYSVKVWLFSKPLEPV